MMSGMVTKMILYRNHHNFLDKADCFNSWRKDLGCNILDGWPLTSASDWYARCLEVIHAFRLLELRSSARNCFCSQATIFTAGEGSQKLFSTQRSQDARGLTWLEDGLLRLNHSWWEGFPICCSQFSTLFCLNHLSHNSEWKNDLFPENLSWKLILNWRCKDLRLSQDFTSIDPPTETKGCESMSLPR